MLIIRKAVSAKAPTAVAFILLDNLIFREEEKTHRFKQKLSNVVCVVLRQVKRTPMFIYSLTIF